MLKVVESVGRCVDGAVGYVGRDGLVGRSAPVGGVAE